MRKQSSGVRIKGLVYSKKDVVLPFLELDVGDLHLVRRAIHDQASQASGRVEDEMIVSPVADKQPHFPVEISLESVATRGVIDILQRSLLVETIPGTLDYVRVREAHIRELDTIGRTELIVAIGRWLRSRRNRRQK